MLPQPSSNPSQAAPQPNARFPAGIEVLEREGVPTADILTPAALAFAARLEREFGGRRQALLRQRVLQQEALDAGWRPGFLAQTEALRQAAWRVAEAPLDLSDRRVEITGPVERKMIINALNSGAKVFMADFEDSNSPTWRNCIEGQRNLRDAVRRQIDFTHPESGKSYRLGANPATLMVRPRGWHLEERNVLVEGLAISASLFDFAIYFYHNAAELLSRGSGPYFYLPKLESHLEARLWNDVFVRAQELLEIPQGSIRATVLIETILAAFQMDEILHELRAHSAGLNCGRWDYIFSFIKRFRADPNCLLPDRATVGMERHFLRSYSRLLIQTCHRRGAHAMGGMAAQIPIKNDAVANAAALEKVRLDKRREAQDGHDGTWVAHPALVPIAQAEFDAQMPGSDQFERLLPELKVAAEDLLRVPGGAITEAGLRQNLSVSLYYVEAWLRGSGCVPIAGLMEDAATAEISRTQVWQWIQHAAQLEDGRTLSASLARHVLEEELAKVKLELGDVRYRKRRFELACSILEHLITRQQLDEFLTLCAQEYL